MKAQNIFILFLILFSAGLLYYQFLPEASSLWYSPDHDRNVHYVRSQKMSFQIKQGNLRGVIKEINAATVWPPFHPLITSLTLLGSTDYRLAVLSSLISWMAICWLTFALSHRLAFENKNLAGWIALILTLASPGYRAYATDIMIESLGAALTLGTLYFYVSARQEQSSWRSYCFALLFFFLSLTKYNYWTIVAVGLLLGAFWEFRVFLFHKFCNWHKSISYSNWFAVQFRQPLTYLLVPAFIWLALRLTDKHRTIETLDIPARLFFIFLFLRILPWWITKGFRIINHLPIPARQFFQLQVYPLIFWFFWAQHLSSCIWSITYGQHGRAGDYSFLIGSFPYYYHCLLQDYFVNLASLILVFFVVTLVLLNKRYWQKITASILIFFVVACLLTNYNLANRSRFLHSWLTVTWVIAGIGVAGIFDRINRRISFSKKLTSTYLLQPLMFSTVAGLIILQGSALIRSGYAEEGGPKTNHPSMLDFADAVVPELIHAEHPILISEVPYQWLIDWRLAEHQKSQCHLITPPEDILKTTAEYKFIAWLDKCPGDLILVVEQSPSLSYLPIPGFDINNLKKQIKLSGKFVLVSELRFPAYSNIIAQIWRVE